jgi:hypothetical protein
MYIYVSYTPLSTFVLSKDVFYNANTVVVKITVIIVLDYIKNAKTTKL